MKEPVISGSDSLLNNEIEESTSVENALHYSENKDQQTEENNPKEPEVPELPAPDDSSKKYHIVAASFPNESLAKTHMKKLEAYGYTPEILISESGKYRVVIKSYESKKQPLKS
ncbi:MAG: SPOR domain-containing protein [Bacteroidales bacterium]|nr:SPOR domain-containing protein [Bacteroidales bacterium]